MGTLSVFASGSSAFSSEEGGLIHVPDIERSLDPLGREYIVGDRGVTATTDVLRGRMQVLEPQPGMLLYRTEVQDLCSMRTSNLLYPGVKIVIVLAGETELSYGERRFHLRAQEGACRGAMLALARTDRFMRQWRAGRSERKLVLTLSPEWLTRMGVLQGAMAQFAARHLAVAPWQPSPKALALAEQLHRGCSLPPSAQLLWCQSRFMEILSEAIQAVEAGAPAADRRLPVPGVRQLARLVALRDWLATAAADGMDLAAIARHAGMSQAHLQRHFPSVADGQSLGRFVRARRLERARLALEQGRASVAQAAQIAGYRSTTHFAAAFRAQFGMVPSFAKPGLTV
ncbi:Regulatory protein soxS [Delftia tsuruhatensis]|uniref:helix-turn-helix transcriptional regulator n=1 Tax=Delftia tsuruhatensis TaxID=180282 RepID=UPI001E77C797|nr:AraC family transcriptional regulator [Delftia tsuruhatensis]CAB5658849.1 Regulatory protein soxS [Delftia tsuruhatensis]CAC9679522.1 Regulatory protein soxS [Delftia tsuruhatensis]